MSEGTMYFRGIWPGQLIAGKYRIEGAIGEGGMGIVLRAKHLDLDRSVAIKVMRPELAENGEVAERMLLEARAAAMLKSEHVTRVLDVGRLESGAPFIVMEYLEGEDLYTILGHRRRLPVEIAADYLVQACEAVAEAHARGIVHRDLKPENLFLTTRADGEPCIKILDFGISKQRDAQREHFTNPTTALGSPNYMAPEQMRASEPIDARADVWSLGAMLYELVTGRQPFHADGLAAVCMRVMMEEPVPPSSSDPALPEGIDQVVLRCLQKNPDARYQSVAELASALAPFGSPTAREYAQRAWRLLYGSRPSLTEISRSRPSIAADWQVRSTVSLLPSTVTGPQRPERTSLRTRRVLAAATIAGMAMLSMLGMVVRGSGGQANASERGIAAPSPTEPALESELVRPARIDHLVAKLGSAMAVPELERPPRADEGASVTRHAPAPSEPKPPSLKVASEPVTTAHSDRAPDGLEPYPE